MQSFSMSTFVGVVAAAWVEVDLVLCCTRDDGLHLLGVRGVHHGGREEAEKLAEGL